MRQALCVRCSRKRENNETPPHSRHTTKPQHPGDRDHLETSYDETSYPPEPKLARFCRSRLCRNRPRTALVVNSNAKKTKTDTQQTDQLSSRNLYAPPVLERCTSQGGLVLAACRVRSNKKIDPPPPTKSRHALKPQQPDDGMPLNKSHALSQSCLILSTPSLCKSPRTDVAIINAKTNKNMADRDRHIH